MTGSSSVPRGLVARVQRLDRLPRGLPFGVAPLAQLVEVAAGRERLRAVHRDRLAGKPVAAVRHQEGREILQFLDPADPALWITRDGGGAGIGPRPQALAHALGRN